METPFDLLLRNGTCVTPAGLCAADVGVRGGRIAAVGALGDTEASEVFEARGLHVLPGAIDPQVHFREPGFPDKEDLEAGTRAAILGGVTAVFEMPNTSPPTTTREALMDKFHRAHGRAWCDIAFFVGASPENADDLGDLERTPGCSGVKIFMGSSTGTLLVEDDATLARVLASGTRRVAIHAEDEDRLRERRHLAEEARSVHAHPEWRDEETARLATERVVRLARAAGRRIHVLHVTTEEEIELLAGARDIATVEVPPQHLTLAAPDCYDRFGTLVQMNPPIRTARHRDALWRGIEAGTVDCIASDHAPHTLEEKGRIYPDTPSGMPGVQTLLPLMLDHVSQGRLTLERLVELVATGPARVWETRGKGSLVVGNDADLTVVDLKAERTIENSWIASRCGWTPFHGTKVTGWPRATIVGGRVVMREDEVVGSPSGRPVRFH